MQSQNPVCTKGKDHTPYLSWRDYNISMVMRATVSAHNTMATELLMIPVANDGTMMVDDQVKGPRSNRNIQYHCAMAEIQNFNNVRQSRNAIADSADVDVEIGEN